jgi:hypothetical protein
MNIDVPLGENLPLPRGIPWDGAELAVESPPGVRVPVRAPSESTPAF